jgi:hypothetical protein
MEFVYQYVQAVQALIFAGANVRMAVNGRVVTVLSVEVSDGCLKVGSITAASSAEQWTFVSLSTMLTVVFDDWPQEVVQMGWRR